MSSSLLHLYEETAKMYLAVSVMKVMLYMLEVPVMVADVAFPS